MSRCVVCRVPIKKTGFLCRPCARSLDRATAKDMSFYATIKWAADRARRTLAELGGAK